MQMSESRIRRYDRGGSHGRPKAGRRRSGDRQEGVVLARPDGAGPEIRQARQVAVHGHATGARLRRWRRRRGRGRDQSARAAEPRRAHRGGQNGERFRRPSRPSAAWPTTSAMWRSCKRAATASWNDSMCVRRSTRCARASRWPSSTFPIGWQRRRNTCPRSGSARNRRPRVSPDSTMAPANGCASRA